MNIANALNAALPELPERLIQRSVPKLDPRVIAKQQIEAGRPTVLAKLPGAETFIRFEPPQWVLLQLFDGERTYLEISEQATAQTGIFYSEDAVREFASFLQTNTDLFYKSPLERNIALQQKLRGQRLKRKKLQGNRLLGHRHRPMAARRRLHRAYLPLAPLDLHLVVHACWPSPCLS